MLIVEKHKVDLVGRYWVMEGDVNTSECGEVTFCWVEDLRGNRMSDFTDIDRATGIAEMLSEQDNEENSEN